MGLTPEAAIEMEELQHTMRAPKSPNRDSISVRNSSALYRGKRICGGRDVESLDFRQNWVNLVRLLTSVLYRPLYLN